MKTNRSITEKKKKGRSLFYRISLWLHLWLGLISGLVVVVVSLTAAALVFEKELKDLLEPFQQVDIPEHKAMLPPSQLSNAAMKAYGFPSVYGVIYRGEDKSVEVPYYADRSNYQVAYIDPYTGKALHNRKLNSDFFRWAIEGHYQLWLPRPIGKPIVAYGTLIFVICLLTGLALWWPKRWNKKTKRESFGIKWKAKWKRLNYDLHNVLGFYSLLIALVFGLTGMVYGMQWFAEGSYWIASGGKVQERNEVISDTTLTSSRFKKDEDVLYAKARSFGDFNNTLWMIYYPRNEKGTWTVSINPSKNTSWQTRTTQYEQHSLQKLNGHKAFTEVNGGEKLVRLNYDLHVGAIGGIWTKILAFLICLVSTSLPITGFIVWWKKSRKAKISDLKVPQ